MIYTDGIHIVADSLDELHHFAEFVELKRCWFEKARTHPHYDIPPTMRKKYMLRLLDYGGVIATKKEVLIISKATIR